MERLTKWVDTPNGRVIRDTTKYDNMDDLEEWYRKALIKLCDYEDAEEQGRLIKLPCKIGTPIYYIDRICQNYGGDNDEDKPLEEDYCEIVGYECDKCKYEKLEIIESKYTYTLIPCSSQLEIYYTYAEAETKLKEMEEENE